MAEHKVIDARGSFCPGPLMELIRAIREAQVNVGMLNHEEIPFVPGQGAHGLYVRHYLTDNRQSHACQCRSQGAGAEFSTIEELVLGRGLI